MGIYIIDGGCTHLYIYIYIYISAGPLVGHTAVEDDSGSKYQVYEYLSTSLKYKYKYKSQVSSI